MLKQHPFLRALFIFVNIWVCAIVTLLILYFSWLREWQMTWGATDVEVSQYMAGDELLVDPTLNATRAVEIKAPPEKVWPWLIQMGYKRAGLYSFGGLDNGGMPSAERIIPECQNLRVGDHILPLLEVVGMEPNKSMLWRFQKGAGGWENATWSWGLYETKSGHTRLVSRLRQQYTYNSLPEIIAWVIMDPMEIFMMRTTLLGIKRRVESN
ncbi:SRPBCC family protein [bacterium]|nr:SRPBCC family protein [bacterium]MBU1983882.1 SRPBCC family protein [bacterium]